MCLPSPLPLRLPPHRNHLLLHQWHSNEVRPPATAFMLHHLQNFFHLFSACLASSSPNNMAIKPVYLIWSCKMNCIVLKLQMKEMLSTLFSLINFRSFVAE